MASLNLQSRVMSCHFLWGGTPDYLRVQGDTASATPTRAKAGDYLHVQGRHSPPTKTTRSNIRLPASAGDTDGVTPPGAINADYLRVQGDTAGRPSGKKRSTDYLRVQGGRTLGVGDIVPIITAS